ncbi:MAG: DNA translocase FtsK 4TM domain-containing protein [Mariprofundus sp.]|nr:DNA translocase FtsK 4TM domain-containing protein [Mariprofundus sp.]
MNVRLLARESLALFMAGMILLIVLAMASFSAADPSWNHETQAAATNLAGIIGAYIADFFYQLFGYAAWIWVALLAVVVRRLAWGEKSYFSGWTSLFWLPLVIAVAALMHAHIPVNSVLDRLVLPAGTGGALGTMLDQSVYRVLKDVGRDLLLGTLFLSTAVTASHCSLLTLLKLIYRQFCLASGWLIRHGRRVVTSALAKKERIEARDERQEVRKTRAGSARSDGFDATVSIEPEIETAVELPLEEQRESPLQTRIEPLIATGLDVPFETNIEPIVEPVVEVKSEANVEQKPLGKKRVAVQASTVPAKELVEAVVEAVEEAEPLTPVKVKLAARSSELKEVVVDFNETSESEFTLPSINLFDQGDTTQADQDPQILQDVARMLERKLLDYRVEGKVVAVQPGPVVTQFELEPAPGTKVNRIVVLQDDLARSMAAISVRVAGNIPGKSVIGIEIPNDVREMVVIRQVLASASFANNKLLLPMAMGVDISGQPVVADLAKMPHLLVAGTTGSGKSVAVNAMICSMLMTCTPQDMRMILVDPKMLELSVYDDIPHLLVPVVTNPHKAAKALAWAVYEMERRYQLMSDAKVRNVDGYNKSLAKEDVAERLPLIVIVIDELADLMMVAGKEVEQAICRIAQKARAAGLHLVLATQRPSVDVITGLIKANLPSRLSFQVSSKIDSRTILDQMGAEQLLGHGDSLFLSGSRNLRRVHGAFVSDAEVLALVEHLKTQGAPDYREEVFEVASVADATAGPGGAQAEDHDEKYDEAAALVIEKGSCSVSMVQRYLRIGYNRASRLVEKMEQEGLVTPPGSGGLRKVLARSGATGGGVIE